MNGQSCSTSEGDTAWGRLRDRRVFGSPHRGPRAGGADGDPGLRGRQGRPRPLRESKRRPSTPDIVSPRTTRVRHRRGWLAGGER